VRTTDQLPMRPLYRPIFWKSEEGGKHEKEGVSESASANSGKLAQDNHQGLSEPSRPSKLGRMPCQYAALEGKVSLVTTQDSYFKLNLFVTFSDVGSLSVIPTA